MRLAYCLMLPAAVAAAAVLAVAPVQAAPQCKSFTCVDTIYYAKADKERAVGLRSTCPGRKGLRGRATRFFDRETDRYEICSETPTKLPCEFLAGGCRAGTGRQP